MSTTALLGSSHLGKLTGRFAVDVDENFRVTFAFEAGHAVEVDYGDYH